MLQIGLKNPEGLFLPWSYFRRENPSAAKCPDKIMEPCSAQHIFHFVYALVCCAKKQTRHGPTALNVHMFGLHNLQMANPL